MSLHGWVGFFPVVTIAVGMLDAHDERCLMELEKNRNTKDGLIL